MRLLANFEKEEEGKRFAYFLEEQKIPNNLDLNLDSDGKFKKSTLWIIEENDLPKASELLQEFKENPLLSKFDASLNKEVPEEPLSSTVKKEFLKTAKENLKNPLKNEFQGKSKKRGPFVNAHSPYLTLSLLLLCVFLYAIEGITTPVASRTNPLSQTASFIESPLNKMFLFDYPEGYEILGSIIKGYGIEGLEDPSLASPAEKVLLEKFQRTPVFQGIYKPLILDYQHPNTVPLINAPLFEKIKQGELWRLFTPILLHGDLIHLFFNMVWLFALGSQIERKLGAFKYLFFILIVAAISNTAQYLVGGPNFVGFSGILFAFATYIWFGQKKDLSNILALDKKTMRWLMIFLLFLITLQLISFFLEAHFEMSMNVGIANTAHLVGALLGCLLAKLRIFQ